MMNRKMMMDRAGRAMGRGMNAARMGRAMADRMGGGMRMQPPTPVNRPVPDELVYKKGGSVKESKAMMKKEVAFMKKKGAPKSMIRHEEKEAGMKKMNVGGQTDRAGTTAGDAFGRIGTSQKKMRMGGMAYSKGGSTGGSYRKAADGIASKGKTKGKMVRMRMGGEC